MASRSVPKIGGCACVAFLQLFAGCGRRGNAEEPAGEKVFVDIAVEGTGSSFWLGMLLAPLAPATRFSVEVEGCASGFGKTLNDVNGTVTLEMYKGDANCHVSLKSFNLGLRTFLPAAGNSWDKHDSASAVFRFASATSPAEAEVTNPDNLPSNLSGPASVLFRFAESNVGLEQKLVSTGAAGVLLPAPEGSAPSFTWASGGSAIVPVEPASGSLKDAVFSLKMRCDGGFSAGNPLDTSTCDGTTVGTLQALLVLDTTLRNGGAGLSFADAEALFVAHAGKVQSVTNDRVWSLGEEGGLRFPNLAEAAETDLDVCRSYLLLLRKNAAEAANRSYRFFNFDFATGGTTCPGGG